MKQNHITLRSLVVGVIVCAVFAIITVFGVHRLNMEITDTQIPVMPYVLLFLTVLLINPICKLIRIVKPFSVAEILIIFTMGVVTSGISTYGLSSQLIPFSGGLYNGDWSNDQTRWNMYVVPYVNEDFFVSEEGIQQAALEYTRKQDATKQVKSVYDGALILQRSEDALEKARANLKRLQTAGSVARVVAEASDACAVAESVVKDAEEGWADVRPEDVAVTRDVVLETYPARVREHERAVAESRAALAVLEAKAFEKVRLFREGLPRGLRAFPGFLPTGDDEFSSYVARVRRMLNGRKSLQHFAEVKPAVEARDTEKARAKLLAAAEALTDTANDTALLREQEGLNSELVEIRAATSKLGAEMQELYDKKRTGLRSDEDVQEDRIAELSEQSSDLETQEKELKERLEMVKFQCEMAARVQSVRSELEVLSAGLATLSQSELDAKLNHVASQYRLFDGTLKRFLLSDIPWSHWLGPLARWGILIVLTYLVLMTFNVLIFRQWAHNERLIYPLAELPEHLAGVTDEAGGGGVPAVFRSGLFWVGASISGIVLGWNLICGLDIAPGLSPLNLTNLWHPFLRNTILSGIAPEKGGARSDILFTMIGLSFLIPKKISFSLWFFSIVYMAQLLILVWGGYGIDERSFQSDQWYLLNFRYAEGGGALLVFSSVVLFKCRRYLFCCFSPSSVAELESGERKELRISSALFLMGSVGLVAVLSCVMGANIYHTIFFFIVMLLITTGMVRAVTEGGILGFQCGSNPFHVIKAFVGMDKAWTAPSLLAPLMVYFAVLFFDLKTFIAPAMANALKIRSDLKLDRRRFYLAMFFGIAVAVLIAVLAELMMSYSKGANEMSSWFYRQLPQNWGYGRIAKMSVNPPLASSAQTSWIAAGGIAMAALLFFRRFLFMLPHPIGLIMLVNPLMSAYWFSIFLGWGAKSLVTKYGSKDLYAKMRYFFIGLIFGELLLVAIALLLSFLMNIQLPITLNRKV